MPPPEKHGGGYVPALSGPFSFPIQRRSTTDQAGPNAKAAPRDNYHNAERSKGVSHSTTHEPHAGHFLPPPRAYTSNPANNHNHNNSQQTGRPARVETMPHLRYHGMNHGGDYVPNIARSPYGTRNAADYRSNTTGDTFPEGKDTLYGVVTPEEACRRDERHGGGYIPELNTARTNSTRSQDRRKRLLKYLKR
ncbi:hypothetical protein ASPSYDRAFT_92343 [Aspergillus sydowii CBS 593.65]|uniref:Uncharacterized protein n=1 Tax=Aspergillus sydowii CBS 593.65 TaxID=1036612 RepID=A0A1L9T9S9_9EURO|nr:uncharacterized protein ASPSYDRAFT_92343 [Aspergillus sydowii CBS 593.65]OJJ56151.1 hypothetical protein ASPSYDRAFT_92343 [Aspergillus sydowii CBS 593.65]